MQRQTRKDKQLTLGAFLCHAEDNAQTGDRTPNSGFKDPRDSHFTIRAECPISRHTCIIQLEISLRAQSVVYEKGRWPASWPRVLGGIEPPFSVVPTDVLTTAL